MSRFCRALAAITTAAAAAAGGLVLAAGAVPASAALAAPAPHHKTHTVTFSAHYVGKTDGKADPHTEFPCVARRGAAPAAQGCLPPEIHCSITADEPSIDQFTRNIVAFTHASCSAEVTELDLTGSLLSAAPPVTQTDPEPMTTQASVTIQIPCQGGRFATAGSALTTFPPGYVLTGGSNPMHDQSASITINPPGTCFPVVGGGGGGGGGPCALPAPSPASYPAGRQPDFVTCH